MNAFDFTQVTGDILGNLYERFLDPGKRKKVGEYYTPIEVARYVLDRIGFYENPGRLLDPACGSGTFLIAAATGLIDVLVERGVSRDAAVRQALDLVHGLDINVFAAFIAQLQILWHLFPHLKEAGTDGLPDLKVYGGVNSLVYRPQRTLQDAMLKERVEEAEAVRDGHYRYVVGNPPYIRNERLKDRGLWRDFYEEVDFRNSDIAFFFIQRALLGGRKGNGEAMPPWLDEGGRLCYVLPMSIGESRASRRLRERLLDYRLLEVTNLEEVAVHLFPSPQATSRATVVPMLLFLERTEGANDRSVDTNWVSNVSMEERAMRRSRVPRDAFATARYNPLRQFPVMLREEDIPVLKRLYESPLVESFGAPPTPMFGIKRGTKGRVVDHQEPGLIEFYKGQTISTFFLLPSPSGWVDVGSVESRSVWGHESLLERPCYAISKIALTLQSCTFDPNAVAFNDTTVLFVPNEEAVDFAWDMLFNSSLARYSHLLALRTGLISAGESAGEGRIVTARASVYTRVVAALPVPASLVDDSSQTAALAGGLREAAHAIGTRWTDLDSAIKDSEKTHLPIHKVDFTHWEDPGTRAGLRLVREAGAWRLQAFAGDQATGSYLEGPYEVLNLAQYILKTTNQAPTRSNLEGLEIPLEAEDLATRLDRARDPDSPDIRRFVELHSRADQALAKAYGLSSDQLEAVRQRLSEHPLDVLRPRWPWVQAEQRQIQSYAGVDRFA